MLKSLWRLLLIAMELSFCSRCRKRLSTGSAMRRPLVWCDTLLGTLRGQRRKYIVFCSFSRWPLRYLTSSTGTPIGNQKPRCYCCHTLGFGRSPQKQKGKSRVREAILDSNLRPMRSNMGLRKQDIRVNRVDCVPSIAAAQHLYRWREFSNPRNWTGPFTRGLTHRFVLTVVFACSTRNGGAAQLQHPRAEPAARFPDR